MPQTIRASMLQVFPTIYKFCSNLQTVCKWCFPTAQRVWTMKKQIRAESRETTALYSIFPTEAEIRSGNSSRLYLCLCFGACMCISGLCLLFCLTNAKILLSHTIDRDSSVAGASLKLSHFKGHIIHRSPCVDHRRIFHSDVSRHRFTLILINNIVLQYFIFSVFYISFPSCIGKSRKSYGTPTLIRV